MKKVREVFAQYIYMHELVGKDGDEFIKDFTKKGGLDEKEIKELKRLMGFYLKNRRGIMEELSSILVGWKPERLLNLDRAAIIAGICEILTGGNVDDIIYDYGTFAKVFSSEKSPSFVMGVLKSFKEVVKK